MKNKRKKITSWIFIIVLFLTTLLLIGVFIYLNNKAENITKDIAECIGNKSTLFVLSSCSHCQQQEDLFKNYLSYIEVIDCMENFKLCQYYNVTGVPVWFINGSRYDGVQSISKLRGLSGC